MGRLARNFLLWWLLVFLPGLMALGIACAALVISPVVLGVWIMGDEIIWRTVIGAVVAIGGFVGAMFAIIIAAVEA